MVMMMLIAMVSVLATCHRLLLVEAKGGKNCPKVYIEGHEATKAPTEAMLREEMVRVIKARKAIMWKGDNYVETFDAGGAATQTFGGFEAFPNDDSKRKDFGGGQTVLDTMSDVIAKYPLCKGWHTPAGVGQVPVKNCDYCWDEFNKILSTMVPPSSVKQGRFKDCKEIATSLQVPATKCD